MTFDTHDAVGLKHTVVFKYRHPPRHGLDPKDRIVHVRDRLFNDARYWMDNSKLRALGWEERTTWEVGFKQTVDWYKAHQEGHWPSIEGALAAHPGDGLDEKPLTVEAAE